MAHWATTEARFRRHFRRVPDASALVHVDDVLVFVTQDDVVQRHVLDVEHPAYVPDFGVYIDVDNGDGTADIVTLSRQMVLFCVERRKAWRMLQSRAGVENQDYTAQKVVRAALADDEVVPDRFAYALEKFAEELAELDAT